MDATTTLVYAVRDGRLDLMDRSYDEPPMAMLSQRTVRGMVQRVYALSTPQQRRNMLHLARNYSARLTAAQVAELL